MSIQCRARSGSTVVQQLQLFTARSVVSSSPQPFMHAMADLPREVREEVPPPDGSCMDGELVTTANCERLS
jgi:hypothetical protein